MKYGLRHLNAFTLALAVTGAFALVACQDQTAKETKLPQELKVTLDEPRALDKTETGRAMEPPPPAMIVIPDITVSNRASSPVMAVAGMAQPGYRQPNNTSKFPQAAANAIKVVRSDPVSTFSIDVDTASYGVVRNYLSEGAMPPSDAVRVEEMVNYFDYSYPGPEQRDTPFRATYAVYPTPWNADTKILHIGIKGFDLPKAARPPANLVFLIDTSGSMDEPNKLPLLKSAFHLLVDQLGEKDRVAMVAYAGSAGVVLEPTSGADKAKIMAALDRLQAGGSTAGGEGIRMAYKLAEDTFIKDGVNRVLLATDGDFNVGITDPSALESFVIGERDKGVELSCLGFGNDNYNDAMMQKIAQAGNGNASFIDTINEARKVFVSEIAGTRIGARLELGLELLDAVYELLGVLGRCVGGRVHPATTTRSGCA